jgi:hypothetical protein
LSEISKDDATRQIAFISECYNFSSKKERPGHYNFVQDKQQIADFCKKWRTLSYLSSNQMSFILWDNPGEAGIAAKKLLQERSMAPNETKNQVE